MHMVKPEVNITNVNIVELIDMTAIWHDTCILHNDILDSLGQLEWDNTTAVEINQQSQYRVDLINKTIERGGVEYGYLSNNNSQ